jgi:transposase-like protein
LEDQERTMKKSKFWEEQIAYALRQADGGTPVGDVCRQLGVSEATFYAWRKTANECEISIDAALMLRARFAQDASVLSTLFDAVVGRMAGGTARH